MSEKNVPLRCPIAFQCKRRSDYRRVVEHLKANQTYFLNHPEEKWKLVKNCPHKIEDGYWEGCNPEESWLRYLSCEIFSRWFWKQVIEKRGAEE